MVAIPDLSRLSGAEKDALIVALLERLEVAERRIAELEAKLNEPPKTPDNSSVPPSRGVKSNTPNRATRRDRRDGPGTARRLAAAPGQLQGQPLPALRGRPGLGRPDGARGL